MNNNSYYIIRLYFTTISLLQLLIINEISPLIDVNANGISGIYKIVYIIFFIYNFY